MKHLEDLIYWITERESIRDLKEREKPRPWTADPILQEYRFCNVYREDDTVTRWIQEFWVSPNYDNPSLPFAMAMARLVNWVPTLINLGYPNTWSPEAFVAIIKKQKDEGKKCWTSAYMITGGYQIEGGTKEAIISRVLNTLYNNLQLNPVVRGDTLERASFKLRCPGIGNFLVGQIIADLKYSYCLENPTDWFTWCAVGPGSTAGLNFLHERKQGTGLRQVEFAREVNEVKAIILQETNIELCAQNAQNCLCEFSKYVRTKYYGGRPKSRYTPAVGLEGP